MPPPIIGFVAPPIIAFVSAPMLGRGIPHLKQAVLEAKLWPLQLVLIQSPARKFCALPAAMPGPGRPPPIAPPPIAPPTPPGRAMLHLKQACFDAKLWLLQAGHIQSPGRKLGGCTPPPPPMPPPIIPPIIPAIPAIIPLCCCCCCCCCCC